MRALLAVLALIAVPACSPSTAPDAVPQPTPAPVAYTLPQPNVVMQADPAPPFTYWAPQGATIVNHPHVPGIWFADLNGRRVGTYFGDQCRASEYQRFVGQPLSALPAVPEGVELRTVCSSCAMQQDLRANRMNVMFDEQTQQITEIACH